VASTLLIGARTMTSRTEKVVVRRLPLSKQFIAAATREFMAAASRSLDSTHKASAADPSSFSFLFLKLHLNPPRRFCKTIRFAVPFQFPMFGRHPLAQELIDRSGASSGGEPTHRYSSR
jgi:hypothetical protein